MAEFLLLNFWTSWKITLSKVLVMDMMPRSDVDTKCLCSSWPRQNHHPLLMSNDKIKIVDNVNGGNICWVSFERYPQIPNWFEGASERGTCLHLVIEYNNGREGSARLAFCYSHKKKHSCILMMNKMGLAVTQLDRLLVYKEMQTDLWLDQFILSVHTSTI